MSSLPYEQDEAKRKLLAQQPYTNEWYCKIKDNAKNHAKRRDIEFFIRALDVKKLFEQGEFQCYACKTPNYESPERLSLMRLDTTKGFVSGNVQLFCPACALRKSYTPPKKKKPAPPRSAKKSLWKDCPIQRITYHAAARYYERFEHRYINEGELTTSEVMKAQRAIQKISSLWEKVDDARYRFENAIFVVDKARTKVITLYPIRQPKIQRIRRSPGYYKHMKKYT